MSPSAIAKALRAAAKGIRAFFRYQWIKEAFEKEGDKDEKTD